MVPGNRAGIGKIDGPSSGSLMIQNGPWKVS